jgi:hypothetical protein
MWGTHHLTLGLSAQPLPFPHTPKQACTPGRSVTTPHCCQDLPGCAAPQTTPTPSTATATAVDSRHIPHNPCKQPAHSGTWHPCIPNRPAKKASTCSVKEQTCHPPLGRPRLLGPWIMGPSRRYQGQGQAQPAHTNTLAHTNKRQPDLLGDWLSCAAIRVCTESG